jgi:hypothetical protein
MFTEQEIESFLHGNDPEEFTVAIEFDYGIENLDFSSHEGLEFVDPNVSGTCIRLLKNTPLPSRAWILRGLLSTLRCARVHALSPTMPLHVTADLTTHG